MVRIVLDSYKADEVFILPTRTNPSPLQVSEQFQSSGVAEWILLSCVCEGSPSARL
jgi:hypothetical protein